MVSEDSQYELIRQAASGDRVSLTRLLLLHYDAIRERIRRRLSAELRGLVSEDDVLQLTLIRVAERIASFEPRHGGAFRGWMETIADNLLRDAEKRRRRERRVPPAADGASDSSGPACGRLEQIPRDSTSPSEKVDRRERARRLRSALESLPDDQREVVHRYYILGQSLDQIAEATGRSRDAIRGVSYRARKNLRSLMGSTSFYFSR